MYIYICICIYIYFTYIYSYLFLYLCKGIFTHAHFFSGSKKQITVRTDLLFPGPGKSKNYLSVSLSPPLSLSFPLSLSSLFPSLSLPLSSSPLLPRYDAEPNDNKDLQDKSCEVPGVCVCVPRPFSSLLPLLLSSSVFVRLFSAALLWAAGSG